MARTIARHDYRNGHWGMQSLSLSRVPGGYLVHSWNDPLFERTALEAKATYRGLVAYVSRVSA